MMKNIIKLTIAAIFIWALIGCAAGQNLISEGTYSKKIFPHRDTKIQSVWAINKEGRFIVSGKFYFKRMSGVSSPSKIQVALIDTQGAVIDVKTVDHSPRILRSRSGRRTARFSATFSGAPPEGTTIRLKNVNCYC